MEQERRERVAYFMRRLYRQGLTTTSGGNLSCRADDGKILLSASRSDKAELRWDQVAVLSADGENTTPELRPSIETSMHLAIYRRHPDVQAIVHAHPVTASAFCAVDRSINTHLTAEAYVVVGDPAFAPYATMGTGALADVVAAALDDAVCVLMENHGILTVGGSLLEAFDRLEVLEVAARQTVLVHSLGTGSPLRHSLRAELDEIAGRPPSSREL